jgi:hypothetical protein
MSDARSLCKLTGVGKYRRCAAWGLHGSYNETLRVVCTGNILLLGGQITMVVFKICMVFLPASVYSRDGIRDTSCGTRCGGRVRPSTRRVARTGAGKRA